MLLVLIAMRQLQRWCVGNRAVGLFLVRTLPLIAVLMFVVRAAGGPLGIPLQHFYAPGWLQVGPSSFGREQIEKRLMQMPGQHLVLVRYKPEHDAFDEWVYNAADIDGSKIIWARQLDAEQDQELLAYYKYRKAWLLEADEEPPRLTDYGSSPTTAISTVPSMLPK